MLGFKNGLLLSAATMLIGGWALPASAADLGGDCCADLEERVAELEATTARKGNRKVSLTVSGWVSEEVAIWDDGTERNAYVGTNPVEQSRFRFVGEAKIAKDVSAGYVLEIGVFGGNGGKWDQNTPDGTSPNSLTVRKSSWFLKSDTYGKVTVGQDGMSTYHLLDDADTTMTRNFYDAEGAPGLSGKLLPPRQFRQFHRAERHESCAGATRCAASTIRRRETTAAATLCATILPTIAGFTYTASGEKTISGIPRLSIKARSAISL